MLLDLQPILGIKGSASRTFPAPHWKNSIAVLPLLDLSPLKDQEYFCDGMTEELINRLGNIQGLKVPARTSVFSFKGKTEDVREIGRKLAVENVLEGSLRKEGNQLRITVQLINVSDIRYFEQAVAKDPGCGPAFAGQANCYSLLCLSGYLAPNEGFPRAKEAVMRALEIDDELGEAHASLGYLKLIFEWDRAGAEREFKRALKLNPAGLDVYLFYSMFLSITGRFEEAIAGFRHVIELDPAYPGNYLLLGIYGYHLAGRFDEAISELKTSLDMEPNNLFAQQILAAVYALNGMPGEAVALAEKIISSGPIPEDVQVCSTLGWMDAFLGRRETALGFLNRILEIRTKQYVDAYLIGDIYAGLGEKDKAFEWYNRAYEERAGQMVFIKVDPWNANLHQDPRHKALVKKMGWE